MNRAMYSGVAGLKTHQTRMDVIGNNIANVNTVGYKSQSALFSELLYQNSSNASGPNPTTNIGGINPKQVGLGVKMASISTNITLPGSAETTNNPFDIRITGEAFLIVNNGKDNMFTRDGSFKVDAAGNLVMSSNGYKVMGWQPDTENPNEIKPDTVSALQIMSAVNMTYPPEATTEAYVSGIIDEDSPEVNSKDGKIMNLNFYDARGYSYTAKMKIVKMEGDEASTVNSYACELVSLLDAKGTNIKDNIGASLGGTTVPLANPMKADFKGDSGYVLEDAANGGYTITYTDPVNNNVTVYTIKDDPNGSVSAIFYTNTTEQAAGNGTVLSTAKAWEGVAAAFGYSDADAFRKMTSTVAATATPPGDGNEHKVSTELATLLTQNNVTVSTGPGNSGSGSLNFTGQMVEGVIINFSKGDGSFVGLNGDTNKDSASLVFDITKPDAASFSEINIDFSTLKNVGNEKVSTASATNGSLKNLGGGRMTGKMSGLSIGTEGKIYAAYDNGQTKLLGQIATARFANPSGLQKEGENLYIATQNSGDFDGIGVDVTSDGGKMTPGELEMSNVDLSGELTGMIVTQRGFQANSRIITVSDTMLEELINLKR